MFVSAAVLESQLAYSAWASRRLVRAAGQLTADELTLDFKTADHTVLDTLVHVFAADRLWLARVEGGPSPGMAADADRSLEMLRGDWPALQERWSRWAAGLTDEAAQAEVAYSDLKGQPWVRPRWQIVFHVVNHGTHHRGQVAGFLRALGHTPPPLDLGHFYREGQSSQAA